MACGNFRLNKYVVGAESGVFNMIRVLYYGSSSSLSSGVIQCGRWLWIFASGCDEWLEREYAVSYSRYFEKDSILVFEIEADKKFSSLIAYAFSVHDMARFSYKLRDP